MRDVNDQILMQLKAIRGLLGDTDYGDDVTNVHSPRRPLHPSKYVVKETSDFENANADGTVTLSPGQKLPLVRYESVSGCFLLAVGATDAADVTYWVERDHSRTVGGITESPLGTLNGPFSFVEKLGGAIPATQTVEYWAKLDGGASAPVDLAARIHVEDAEQAGGGR